MKVQLFRGRMPRPMHDICLCMGTMHGVVVTSSLLGLTSQRFFLAYYWLAGWSSVASGQFAEKSLHGCQCAPMLDICS